MQQVHVNGYIEVPDRWEFPAIDQRIELARVVVTIKGEKTLKAKSSGESSVRKHTLLTVLESGATIGKVLPAAPQVEGQTTLEAPTPIRRPRKPAARKRR
jgi:hypothetical protein